VQVTACPCIYYSVPVQVTACPCIYYSVPVVNRRAYNNNAPMQSAMDPDWPAGELVNSTHPTDDDTTEEEFPAQPEDARSTVWYQSRAGSLAEHGMFEPAIPFIHMSWSRPSSTTQCLEGSPFNAANASKVVIPIPVQAGPLALASKLFTHTITRVKDLHSFTVSPCRSKQQPPIASFRQVLGILLQRVGGTIRCQLTDKKQS
jgi:hypothetical protein